MLEGNTNREYEKIQETPPILGAQHENVVVKYCENDGIAKQVNPVSHYVAMKWKNQTTSYKAGSLRVMKARAGTALLDPIPSHLSQNVRSVQPDWPVEAAKKFHRLCATLLVSRKYQTLMRHQPKIRPTPGVFFPLPAEAGEEAEHQFVLPARQQAIEAENLAKRPITPRTGEAREKKKGKAEQKGAKSTNESDDTAPSTHPPTTGSSK